MKYVGSKNKIAKEILPIILKDRQPDQYYFEPFVGGANIIDKVNCKRIGCDTNYYLIEMYKALQTGWEPPDSISESYYKDIKQRKDISYLPALVGFVGIGCSYSGKWFGGYARGNQNNGTARNYCLESKKNLLNQRDALMGVEFHWLDYQNTNPIIPPNSIIYCDPLYEGTTKYKDGIDYPTFWKWVRNLSKSHIVFVSEYNAPPDFECVWSKEVFNTLDKNTGAKKGVEKLFKLAE